MIYFAQLPTGSIKIGKANDVERRMAELEYEFRGPVALLKSIPGGLKEESALHRQFRHLRILGEQFRPDASLMEFIGRPLLVAANPDTVEATDQLIAVRLELSPQYRKYLRLEAVKRDTSASQLARVLVMQSLDRLYPEIKRGGAR
jgi:hypothetical protein